MSQTSYALMLIIITVIMAASLVSIAILLDTYLFHEVPLPARDVNDVISDVVNGRIWNSIVTQLEQLS